MQQDWDHVRVFLAVMRTKQFVGAARTLSVDHATVARRITSLEQSLGAKLFSRSTSGAIPTAEGERFLVAAEVMEAAWLGAQAQLSRIGRAITGSVRIGVPDGFGAFFLAPRLASLAQVHPDLILQLVPLQRSFSLSKREADLAIMIDRPRDGRLTVRKLVDYSLGFYATRPYIAAHGLPQGPDELHNHLVVASCPDLHYTEALNYYPPLFDASQRRLELVGVGAQFEAVRAGVGIGILHDYIARDHDELVQVLPSLRFQRAYHLVAHRDTRQIARVDETYKFIVEAVATAATLFKKE
jgi:DNA-binding transcriptional LysR family regulator